MLSVVATYDLDKRRRQNLEMLWPTSGYPAGLPREAYDAVTSETLHAERFPHLTEIAGRRNADPRWRITPEEEKRGTPILAVPAPDGAYVCFSGGDVRYLLREELGLEDDEPIRFGDEAKSDLLRCLSDE